MYINYPKINGTNVRFRNPPGLSSTVYGLLQDGTVVAVSYVPEVSKDGYVWQQIVYNGVTGWVATNYLIYY